MCSKYGKDVVVNTLNCQLRGCSGYFYYHNSTSVFLGIKRHIDERVRIHLRIRHKLRSRAQGYARPLFTLPTLFMCNVCRSFYFSLDSAKDENIFLSHISPEQPKTFTLVLRILTLLLFTTIPNSSVSHFPL